MDRMKSFTKSINAAKEKAAASIDQRLLSKNSSSNGNGSAAVGCSSGVIPHRNVVLDWMRHDFFTACQNDDYERAYELYTIPYEQCVQLKHEEDEEYNTNMSMEKLKENISKEFRLFKSKINLSPLNTGSNDTANNNNNNMARQRNEHRESLSAANAALVGFLEQNMRPCEFFPPSYFHSYLMIMKQSSLSSGPNTNVTASQLAIKFKEKMKSLAVAAAAAATNSNSLDDKTTEATETTTTPLHEAARLGYPPLLRRMLQQQPDLSIKDWKQRTVLHYICGGVLSSDTTTNDTNTNTNEQHQQQGLKSFYFSAMDQKRQKELDKKEKLAQFFRKIDMAKKLSSYNTAATTASTSESSFVQQQQQISAGTNNNNKKNNITSFWCKIQEKVSVAKLELLQSNTNTSINNVSSSVQTNSTATATTSKQHQDDEDDAYYEDKENIKRRLECLSIVFSYSDGTTSYNPVGINTVDCRIRTALHYAASLERFHLIRVLLRRPNILVTIVDEQGRTCCDLSSKEQVQSILEAKALFNSEDCVVLDHHEQQQQLTTMAIPYGWFETWSEDDIVATTTNRIDEERQTLIEDARDQIKHYVVRTTSNLTELPEFTNTQYSALLEKYNWSIDSLMLAIQDADTSNANNNNEVQDETTQQQQHYKNSVIYDESILSLGSSNNTDDKEITRNSDIITCRICYSTVHDVESSSSSVASASWTSFDESCHHGFCTMCLQEYITTSFVNPTTRISSPTTRIPCPQHDCQMLIPESTLSSILLLTGTNDYEKLKQGERELFIQSSKKFKFCPYAGCKGIVKANPPAALRAQYGQDCLDYVGAVCTACSTNDTNTSTRTYEGIRMDSSDLYSFTSSQQRPVAHRFCFSCSSQTPHWPASCTFLEQWRATVEEEMKGIVTTSSTKGNFEDVAHHLWLKANTRPCPKCRMAIEKNDGCNHMTCSNRHCRYEFCWICRKDWSLHSSKTGGYFLCNRWAEDEEPTDEYVTKPPAATNASCTEGSATTSSQQQPSLEQQQQDPTGISNLTPNTFGTSLHTSRTARDQAKRMARFIFFYGRWTAQKESSNLEKKMTSTLDTRLIMMATVAFKESENISLDLSTLGVSFVHDAFTELLECRSVLQYSYAYAFCRFAPLSKLGTSSNCISNLEIEKLSFEHLQSELEIITEQLSNAVGRSHLRASRSQIMHLTHAAAQMRNEFSVHIISVWYQERQILDEKRAQQQQGIGVLINSNNNQQYEYQLAAITNESAPITRETSEGEMADLVGRMMQLGRSVRADDGIEVDDDGYEHGFQEYFNVFSQAEEEVQLQRALEASLSNGSSTTMDVDDCHDSSWICSNCTFLNTTSPAACAICNNTRQSRNHLIT